MESEFSKNMRGLDAKQRLDDQQFQQFLEPSSKNEMQLQDSHRVQPQSIDQGFSAQVEQKNHPEIKDTLKQQSEKQTNQNAQKASCMNNFNYKLGRYLKHKYALFKHPVPKNTHTGYEIQKRLIEKKRLLRGDFAWLLNRPEDQLKLFLRTISCNDAKKYIKEICFEQINIAEDNERFINQQKDIEQTLQGVDFVFEHLQKDDNMIYAYNPDERSKYRTSRLRQIFLTHSASESNEQSKTLKIPKTFMSKISHIKTLMKKNIQRNPQNEKAFEQKKIEQLKRQTLKLYFLLLSEHERQQKKGKLTKYFSDKEVEKKWKDDVFENDFIFPIKLFSFIHQKLYNELQLIMEEMVKQNTILRKNVSNNTNNDIEDQSEVNAIMNQIKTIINSLKEKFQHPNCQKVQINESIEQSLSQQKEQSLQQQMEQSVLSNDGSYNQDLATIGDFYQFSQSKIHYLDQDNLNYDGSLEDIIPVNDCRMDVEQEWPDYIFGQPANEENTAIEEETDGHITDQQVKANEHTQSYENNQYSITHNGQQMDISAFELLSCSNNRANTSPNLFFGKINNITSLQHYLPLDFWQQAQQ